MKISKLILAFCTVFSIAFSFNSAFAVDSRESNSNSTAAGTAKRPIVSASTSGTDLKFGFYGLGALNNNASNIKMRVKDLSSDWSSFVTTYSQNACGTDIYEFTSPKLLSGEFTLNLIFTSGGLEYNFYYFGVAGINSVKYGKWTLSGIGYMGIIQNQFNLEKAFVANTSEIYPVSSERKDAISVFGVLNSVLTLTNSYGSSYYGYTPLYELYNSCNYNARNISNNIGTFANFTSAIVNHIVLRSDSNALEPDLAVTATKTLFDTNSVNFCIAILNLGSGSTQKEAKINLFVDHSDNQPLYGSTPNAVFTLNANFSTEDEQVFCHQMTLSTGTHKFIVYMDKYNDIYEVSDSIHTTYSISGDIIVSPQTTPTPSPTTPAINKIQVYRFYNKTTKAHFFTTNIEERNNLITTNPQWNYEDVAYYVVSTNSSGTCSDTGASAVYRFYGDPKEGGNQTHFFTINAAEAEDLRTTNPRWKYEGVAWCAYSFKESNTSEVYRFGNVSSNSHFYTVNPAESEVVKKNPDWRYEGIDYYTYLAQ